jgi:hypothetical protein
VHHATDSHIYSSAGATTPWQCRKHQAWFFLLEVLGMAGILLHLTKEASLPTLAKANKSNLWALLGPWPHRKAYRVLTSKGEIATIRQLASDESSAPACITRADCSPFEDIWMTVQTGLGQQPATSPSTPPPSVLQ